MRDKHAQSPAARCEPYLVIEAGEAAHDRLTAILAAAPPASVLIKPRPSRAYDGAETKALIETSQRAGIAALLHDDAALARTLRADGVHLPAATDLAARYAQAREILGARAMIGVEIAVDAPAARHDAMELAEAGADYIGFGPGEAQADLLAWWAEIFEVPCVAFAAGDAQTAAGYAALGVDFVALTLPAATSPADCALHVSALAAALATEREGANA